MKLLSGFLQLKRLAANAAVAVVVTAGLVMSALAPVASANAATFVPTAKVSFTFDDGLTSTMLAAQTLQSVDPSYSGTAYITTGCVGITTPVNNCIPDWEYPYMTWEQISELRDVYGWEIGSHSVTHASLRTADTPIDKIKEELSQSKEDLAQHGFDATAFAFPYGHYDDASLAEAAKLYSSVRRFQDDGNNIYPYNDNTIMIRAIQRNNGELNGTPQQIDEADFQMVKSYIDEAVANNYWLVLVFHDIAPDASTSWEDYEYTPEGLARIAEYVKSINLPVVNMTDGIATSGTNLMPNGSFNDEIAAYVSDEASKDVWSTDDPENIVRDPDGNGSYPDPTNSVKFTAVAAGAGANPTSPNTHLFSPRINVTPSTTYVIKSFVSVTAITSGQVGYYIDEYDINGTWISGQDKAAVASIKATDAEKARALNFLYTPTSADVASFRVEFVISKGSGATGYLDNFQVFPESAIGSEPTDPPAGTLGDLNGDGKVNGIDLSTLLANWNPTTPSATPLLGDLDGNGLVNGIDLSTLLGNWSQQ